MLDYSELEHFWQNKNSPKILMGYYDGKWYYTLTDSDSVLFFMSVDKKHDKKIFEGKGYPVYAVVRSKTIPKGSDMRYYEILGNFNIVSCTKSFNQEQLLLTNYIEELEKAQSL